jgi:hypothetical protein
MTANHTRLAASRAKRIKIGNIVSVYRGTLSTKLTETNINQLPVIQTL